LGIKAQRKSEGQCHESNRRDGTKKQCLGGAERGSQKRNLGGVGEGKELGENPHGTWAGDKRRGSIRTIALDEGKGNTVNIKMLKGRTDIGNHNRECRSGKTAVIGGEAGVKGRIQGEKKELVSGLSKTGGEKIRGVGIKAQFVTKG